MLSPEQLKILLDGLPIDKGTEITLEINPLQITGDYLLKLASTPVNRLSIGLQSMDDNQLAWLGRRHRASQIQHKIFLCQDHGYHNFSLDLIYGLPEAQVEIPLLDNLQAFLDLKPLHLSCYLLSLDEDCALASKGVQLPEDEQLAKQYRTACDTISGSGLAQYEISNFSVPGFASKHNLTYWESRNYLAWGASAAGWLRPLRYQNPANLKAYYRNVAQELLFPEAETCSLEQEQRDWLMMGLRLCDGIQSSAFRWRFKRELPDKLWKKVRQLEQLGMLEADSERIALSSQAYFVSNSVIGELLQCI